MTSSAIRQVPLLAFAALVSTLVLACGSPNLTGTNWSCRTNADCDPGQVCGSIAGAPACMTANTTPIAIGMSGPLQGPSQDLGIEMRRGISAMFQRVNAAGGVFGRTLELRSMNDNYDPALAKENMKVLLDIQQESSDPDMPDVRGNASVFAILGNIGTPTMLETAPIATRDRVLFFAPFTGAQKYLRDGTNSPYVYNYRAGYYQEADAMIDYMATYRQPRIIASPSGTSYRRILAFTQRDSYGDAGYNGLVNAYNRLSPLPQPDSTKPDPSIRRLYYDRDVVSSVEPAITEAATLLTGLLAEGTDRVVGRDRHGRHLPAGQQVHPRRARLGQPGRDARDAPRRRVHARVVRGQRRARRCAGQPAGDLPRRARRPDPPKLRRRCDRDAGRSVLRHAGHRRPRVPR